MTEGAEGAFRLDWQLQNDKQDDKDAPEGDTGWLEFLPLNGLTLPITTKATEKQSLLHIWCVPIAANRSRMLMVNRRNFGQFNPLLSLFNLLTPVILQEDRRIMDTASPSEVPPIGAEVFIPSDTSTIAFSRYYEKHFLNQRANLIAVNLGD